jgi:hypothetical protein
MNNEVVTNGQECRPDAGRAWYATHRADVLARLAVPTACGRRQQRSAALLVLAFDEDPATVARARVGQGAGL